MTAARHFQYRLNVFFNDFLKSTAQSLGEIIDYAIRIEFQAIGSPHAHTVIWVKNAPKYGINSNSEVCAFIDKYITCEIPDNDEMLKELVLTLQQHKHSSYCKCGKACRFHFPKPPSYKTLIAEPSDNEDDIKQATNILSKVRKQLVDGNIDICLDELLADIDSSFEHYMNALNTSSKGNVVVLKRKPCECKINNYNPFVTQAWQANTDIQFVLNAYACVMYVVSYIMKTEKAMGQLLRSVAEENRTDELKVQLKKLKLVLHS